jgi:hypothetical protein
MANRLTVTFLFLLLAGKASAAGEEGIFPNATIDRLARGSVPIACATDVQGKIGI